MGVKLLVKIKVHELAKELDKASKDILAVAKELGIEAKSHMSSINEADAEKIKNKLGFSDMKKEDKKEKKKRKKEKRKFFKTKKEGKKKKKRKKRSKKR